jgi:adenylate kinase
LVFLGAPGVGKGTFASRVSKKLNIPAISTGDIIRAEIKKESAYGKQLQTYTSAGKLVPDALVTQMVKERLSQADAKNGWLLVRMFTCARAFHVLNAAASGCRMAIRAQFNRPKI